MTCSQQPELRLSLNYTDGQRNMWSYYAPNGRRYQQILVEKQCLCGSRLDWTKREEVTISPERLRGLKWRLTGVKCRASSGCVQIPTGIVAQMEEIRHKVLYLHYQFVCHASQGPKSNKNKASVTHHKRGQTKILGFRYIGKFLF